MRQGRTLVRHWAIIAVVPGLIAGAGCGVGTMGGIPHCEEATIDPELGGCFEPVDGPEMGQIEIEQYECNLLTGSGDGLIDLLGTGFDGSWSFSGEVGAAGYARLFIRVPGRFDSVFVEAFQEISDSGEAVLSLRRPAILAPMELIPCS